MNGPKCCSKGTETSIVANLILFTLHNTTMPGLVSIVHGVLVYASTGASVLLIYQIQGVNGTRTLPLIGIPLLRDYRGRQHCCHTQVILNIDLDFKHADSGNVQSLPAISIFHSRFF